MFPPIPVVSPEDSLKRKGEGVEEEVEVEVKGRVGPTGGGVVLLGLGGRGWEESPSERRIW